MIWLKFGVCYLAKNVSASSPVKGRCHGHWASQGVRNVEDGSCVTSSVNIITNQSCANTAVALQSWFIEFEGDQLNWSRRSKYTKECTLLHSITIYTYRSPRTLSWRTLPELSERPRPVGGGWHRWGKSCWGRGSGQTKLRIMRRQLWDGIK